MTFCIQETKEYKEAALTLASIRTAFGLVPRIWRCVTFLHPSTRDCSLSDAVCVTPLADRCLSSVMGRRVADVREALRRLVRNGSKAEAQDSVRFQ